MTTEIPVDITFNAQTITLNEISFSIPYDILSLILVAIAAYVLLRIYFGYRVYNAFEHAIEEYLQ
jgi:hypothetical protein